MTLSPTALSRPSADTGVVSSPIDQFLDRAAYRNMLNSAKNAVSLDELHDKDGAALIRLSFSATTLPPRGDYLDTLGLLRMEVREPFWTYEDLQKLYLDWLDHVNHIFNIDDISSHGDGNKPLKIENPEMIGLRALGDLFDVVYYHYDKTPNDKKARGRKDATNKKDAASNEKADFEECEGISFRPKPEANCATLTLATPRLRGYYVFARGEPEADTNLQDLFSSLIGEFGKNAIDFRTRLYDAQEFLNEPKGRLFLPKQCVFDLASPILQYQFPNYGNLRLNEILRKSFQMYWVSQQFSTLEFQAKRILNKTQLPISKKSEQIYSASRGVGNVIASFMDRMNTEGCEYLPNLFASAFIPPRFITEVRRPPQRVAVYEVGPREQVQQLSTVARAGEAVGLAAAISGQIPMYGIGVDGNVDYSRSAAGKADALERAPLVVSFTESATVHEEEHESGPSTSVALPAFGWLLGPKVSLDAKEQKLMLEQRLKPYDLSVDLSVPGWWPYLVLKTTTAWAPNWRQGDGHTITGDGQPREIKVNLAPNAADFAALTNSLRGTSSIRRVSIDSVVPDEISACATNLVLGITGESVWRTNAVLVGGRKFSGTEVIVMPDMRGVLVSIDNARFPVPLGTIKIPVTILTPYGADSHDIALKDAKSDGLCKSDVQTVSNSKTSTTIKTSVAEKPAPSVKRETKTGGRQSIKPAP